MKKKYLLISAIIIGLIVLHFYFKQEKVYTLKEYSPSGSLTGISDYVIRNGDTIFHGKFINYSEKKELK